MVDKNPPLIAIVGPTASGKTGLSIELAQQFSGEVISADSRLLYAGMDIGTAKPTIEERAGIPHHMIDVCQPNQTMTLGQYQDWAYYHIDEIISRRNLPFMVGGTGQYVDAVMKGWGIPRVAPQHRLRAALEKLDGEELNRWLAALDPEKSAEIDQKNLRRVIRALEVTLVAGQPMSQLQQKSPPPYRTLYIGLQCEREWLYERIDRRVDLMMEAGLLDEVQGLLKAGFAPILPAFSGLGYRQLIDHIHGKMTLDEAVERIKFETHRFARQQRTWFHPDDENIVWFDAASPHLNKLVISFLTAWLQHQV